MRKSGLFALVSVLALPQIIVAQDNRVARVAKALPSTYVQATCDIKNGHFLVSSSATYLKSAGEAKDVVKRTDMLEKGVEVALRAITESDQGTNGAAWYFLGRNALQLGDITMADSAFTRAAALIPECAEDMKAWRQRAWMSMATPATEFVKKGNPDSALALFREAGIISRSVPIGFYNMGVIFANAAQTDSAITYFEKAKQVAEADLKRFTPDRNSATFNLAAMYQRNGQHEKAIAELQQYIGWVPDDQDARRALASSLRSVGRNDDAAKVEKELVASAEASGTLSSGDVMAMGINLFNDKKFAEAAASFEKVLQTDPNNHDAMYNLANSYLALENGAKLTSVAKRLVEQEPLSDDNRRLLAQGYNLQKMQDSLIAVVTELMALPTNVTVTAFQPRASGALITGTAIGKKAERDAEAVPAAPKTLVVEFLDKDGKVVEAKEVEIPALMEAQTFEWKADATGEGITGWRYHVK
ncbi:MAG TPA: tetratricopeptide repeat protein [Gemmatimonadales bacterium]|nr:tetratricopeptide repeat protein [Gemmatimonadales bacterium]